MEILVLIKQVPDDSVEVKLDPATGAPNLNGVEAVVNAFDTYALEMAKRYIEDNGGNVTVATIGDDDATAALRTCLAVGAGKAFLIKDASFAGSDTTAKAYILSKAVAKIDRPPVTQHPHHPDGNRHICSRMSINHIPGNHDCIRF